MNYITIKLMNYWNSETTPFLYEIIKKNWLSISLLINGKHFEIRYIYFFFFYKISHNQNVIYVWLWAVAHIIKQRKHSYFEKKKKNNPSNPLNVISLTRFLRRENLTFWLFFLMNKNFKFILINFFSEQLLSSLYVDQLKSKFFGHRTTNELLTD